MEPWKISLGILSRGKLVGRNLQHVSIMDNSALNIHILLLCIASLLYHRLPSSKYLIYAAACVYGELYGKITDRKKNCTNNYLIWNKFFLPQMCRELVSCADFKAILTLFSEVIWNCYPSSKRHQNGFKIGTRDKFVTH